MRRPTAGAEKLRKIHTLDGYEQPDTAKEYML